MIIQFLQNQLMNDFQTQHILPQLQLLRFSLFFHSYPQDLSAVFHNRPACFSICDPHLLDSKTNQETDATNFEPRIASSTIIQSSSNSTARTVLKIETQSPLKKSNIPLKKMVQKEGRNVSSNLMRIFLRNVMELRIYDESISKMIRRRGLEMASQEFYGWLASFGINYKNYIRFTEVRRLFTGTASREMHVLIRALFRSYVKGLGICHTLTSKRIERGSTAMHLEGLRSLALEFGII